MNDWVTVEESFLLELYATIHALRHEVACLGLQLAGMTAAVELATEPELG